MGLSAGGCFFLPMAGGRSRVQPAPLQTQPRFQKPAFIYSSSPITCKPLGVGLVCFFFSFPCFFLKKSVISKKEALLDF